MLTKQEWLDKLRKLIVYVDTCLEKGDLKSLNDELNEQVKFILKEEEEVPLYDPWSHIDIDFEGFMEKKLRPKFGWEGKKEEEIRPTNNSRFEHIKLSKYFKFKTKDDVNTGSKSGDTEVREAT